MFHERNKKTFNKIFKITTHSQIFFKLDNALEVNIFLEKLMLREHFSLTNDVANFYGPYKPISGYIMIKSKATHRE